MTAASRSPATASSGEARVASGSATIELHHHWGHDLSDAPHSETRDFRIREFNQIWDKEVVAIEESAGLRVVDTRVSIVGKGRAKIFTKGDRPRLFEAGEDLPVRFVDELPNSSYLRSATTAR
jgi:hypothetical protein